MTPFVLSKDTMRLSELTRARRRRLSRYAHKLARSGRFESAEAFVSEIRGHEDFDQGSHEAAPFLAALSVICDVAARKRNQHWRTPPRPHSLQQQPAASAARAISTGSVAMLACFTTSKIAHPRVGCRGALIRLPLSRVPDGPGS